MFISQQLKAPASRRLIGYAVLALSLVLTGCGDKNEREFIRGCKAGGGSTTVCGCIWDELKPQYQGGELEKMHQQYGYIPPHFMDNLLKAAQRCQKKE